MKYPSRPLKVGEWGLATAPPVKPPTGPRPKRIWLQFIMGKAASAESAKIDWKMFDITAPTFEQELDTAIRTGLRIIKKLNFDGVEEGVSLDGRCANCVEPCLEDDYLCQTHRDELST